MFANIFIVGLWLCIAAVWVGLFQVYGIWGAIATYLIYLIFKKIKEEKK